MLILFTFSLKFGLKVGFKAYYCHIFEENWILSSYLCVIPSRRLLPERPYSGRRPL